VRERATNVSAEKKVRFTSTILPRWARRSRSLDALLPSVIEGVKFTDGIAHRDATETRAA